MRNRKSVTLDVRPLLARGEDPFATIRAKVDRLAAGQRLTIIAPFLPAPLIEVLQSEGFSFAVQHRTDGGWSVDFWRPAAR